MYERQGNIDKYSIIPVSDSSSYSVVICLFSEHINFHFQEHFSQVQGEDICCPIIYLVGMMVKVPS